MLRESDPSAILAPVLDQATGAMWLSFRRNNDDVFVTSSNDDRLTWAPPRKITADVKVPDWRWYATGPGVDTSALEVNARKGANHMAFDLRP